LLSTRKRLRLSNCYVCVKYFDIFRCNYKFYQMRKYLYNLLFLYLILFGVGWGEVIGQSIYAPEGLNMPGTWTLDSFTNPPSNLAIASSTQVADGRVLLIETGTRRWQTIFSVASSGADFQAGTYDWLFTSGSSNNAFNNTWRRANQAVQFNTVQDYFYNAGSGDTQITLTNDRWYIMNWRDVGYANTTAIFMEISGGPVQITNVSQSPVAANVAPGQDLTVTVTTNNEPASDEKLFVIYTTDAFESRSAVPLNFTGTTGTATIPGQTGGTNVTYYVMSTSEGVSLLTSGQDGVYYDMRAIRIANNDGSNFSYIVNTSWETATGATVWSSESSWASGEVPIGGQTVTIAHDLNLDTDIIASSIIVNSGKTLTINSGQTLTMTGGIGGGGALVVNGTLQINAGGSSSIAPTYNAGSALIYNTGGQYGQGAEWPSSNGPVNVIISNNGTNLDLTGNRSISGTLTINDGTEFDLNSHTLTLSGSATLTNNGTFTASTGTVFFDGAAAITNPVSFNNATLNAANINLNASTVNGTLTLNSNGSLANSSSVGYGDSGVLSYQGGTRNATALEWPTSSGPNSILIGNNTSLTLPFSRSSAGITIANGSGLTVDNAQTLTMTGGIGGAGALAVNGTLQINPGGFTEVTPAYGAEATLTYNTGGPYTSASEWPTGTGSKPHDININNSSVNFGAADQPRYLSGDLTISGQGTLTLSSAVGGDLHIAGNWSNLGTFYPNNRAVFFDGSSPQTIENNQDAGIAIPYLFIHNDVTALSNLTVDEFLEFNVDNTFTLNGSLTYRDNATLKLTGSSDYTTSSTFWPASGGPSNLEIAHSGIITLHEARSLTGELGLEAGSTLLLNAGVTLEMNNLDNNGTITLRSSSNDYAGIIPVSVQTNGTINYHRHTNAIGSGTTGGNDLVSPPLGGMSFDDFVMLNEALAHSDFTVFAYAPFDNQQGIYTNYTTDNGETVLQPGKGYRAATITTLPLGGDRALTYTGTAATGNVDVRLTSYSGTYGSWNAIGNPYPSYISISDLLNQDNMSQLSENAQAIYGYDGAASDGWDVINLSNAGSRLMAPGQGFFVSVDLPDNGVSFMFTPAMRRAGSGDDFIQGRNTQPVFVKLKASSATQSYSTSVYFNNAGSLGLDPGYDAQTWGGQNSGFILYSHLLADNQGVPMALQTLPETALNNSAVPLGINSGAGVQLRFSIAEIALPEGTMVYLEDRATGTFTLLNTSDYVVTPTAAVSGTGRFYLHFSADATLGVDNALGTDIDVYAPYKAGYIAVSGNVAPGARLQVFDMLGRTLLNTVLTPMAGTQHINVSQLPAAPVIVKLNTPVGTRTIKLMLSH
jgi:hypothetical protein